LRSEYAVRTINGPFVCGDGMDLHEGKILSASWVAEDALQVCFISGSAIVEFSKLPLVYFL